MKRQRLLNFNRYQKEFENGKFATCNVDTPSSFQNWVSYLIQVIVGLDQRTNETYDVKGFTLTALVYCREWPSGDILRQWLV